MPQDFTNGKIQDHPDLLLYCDGACEPTNPGGVCTAGWVIFDRKTNERLVEDAVFVREGDKLSTNNMGEYCALGFALRFLHDQGWAGTLHVRTDSQLVVNQVLEKWKCNSPHLQKLRARIWELMEQLGLEPISPENEIDFQPQHPRENPCVIAWVRRELNADADALSKKAFHERQAKTGKKWPFPRRNDPH